MITTGSEGGQIFVCWIIQNRKASPPNRPVTDEEADREYVQAGWRSRKALAEQVQHAGDEWVLRVEEGGQLRVEEGGRQPYYCYKDLLLYSPKKQVLLGEMLCC